MIILTTLISTIGGLQIMAEPLLAARVGSVPRWCRTSSA
jgi:hypothetical protein